MKNPPAFPSPAIPSATDNRDEQRDGMTLRDWFAGRALAALLALLCLVNAYQKAGREIDEDRS